MEKGLTIGSVVLCLEFNVITQEECQALQKAGAQARAAGRTEIDNPYYRQENMPPVTGDTMELWALKEECWRLGWKIENMIRSK